MKSELLARSPMLVLPLVALFLFIAIFGVVLIATLRKRAPAYDPMARMPLEDEDEPAAHAAEKGTMP